MKCPNPDCIGLDVKNNEAFCPWCGQRRDVYLIVEEQEGSASGQWIPLQRFFSEERPQLRLRLKKDEKCQLPENLPLAWVDCKWLEVGEWASCESGLSAALRYRPSSLPADAKERAYRAELKLNISSSETLRTHLEVYPRPSYEIETEKDGQGITRLLKDENGYVHFRFQLLRFGPTTGLRLRARVPAEFLADGEGGSSSGVSVRAGDETVGRHCKNAKEKTSIPNLWGDSAPAVLQKPGKKTSSSLWDKQSLEVNWLDSAGSKRRCGEISYRVRGGDSEPYKLVFVLSYRGRIGSDNWRAHEFTQEISVPVQVIGRPLLKILGSVGRTSWSVLTNRSEDFSIPIELTNGGRDSRLKIVGVRLSELPAELKVELSGSAVQGGEIVNVQGQSKSLRVYLRLREIPSVGNYNFHVIFTYIKPSAEQGDQREDYARLIGLRVGQPKTLPGSVLAVDFGTSSSCAAALGVGTDQEMISVESNGKDSFSLASLALYVKDKVTLGEAARLLSYKYPLALLESPKRDIGRREFFEVLPAEQSWMKIAVADVVSEFYRFLLSKAQDSVVKIKRASKDDWNCCNFENLAVSHPSRFNYSQKQMMATAALQAFRQVFGDATVREELVQEPLAAALAYVAGEAVQAGWHERKGGDNIEYSLLVYDCGGGTTDLCCLEVHSQRSRCSREGCADYSQLSDEQRARLLPAALLRLLPGASAADISAWAQFISSCGDWQWAWSEHAELKTLPFEAETLIGMILDCANSLQEQDSFTVEVRIKGASGDPTFGGTNVTEEIAQLVRACFPDLIVDESGEDDKKVKARRNVILLRRFAEQLKCRVSSTDDAFIGDILNGELAGTLVTANGPVPNAELIDKLKTVNRGLYKRLRYANGGSQTRIANLGDECLALSQRCFGAEMPDVILLTGRGSQWPGIRGSLELKFPGVPVVLLGDGNEVKHCVAKGAGVLALVRSGAKLAGGQGVHIVNISEDMYTTSSLCLQCGVQMEELIGAGCRFNEQNVIEGRHVWRLIPGEEQIEVAVYLSDVPGACLVAGDAGQRESMVKLATFAVSLPSENSVGSDGQICLELRPNAEPGYAELHVALEADGSRYYGILPSGEDSLAVMIMNK
ncbi:MAG: hypothetical protein Q4F00_10655 [bacterium]|nr:hypothetical protein [bacterium]